MAAATARLSLEKVVMICIVRVGKAWGVCVRVESGRKKSER